MKELLGEIKRQVRFQRTGLECYGFGQLALGFVDLIVDSWMEPYDFCTLVPIVEGAGGLLVPVSNDARDANDANDANGEDMADLAARLELPLIVVARSTLGTINHTRLSLQVAKQRGLEVAGVVISHTARISHADEENLSFLRSELGDSLLAEIPFAPRTDGSDFEKTFAFPIPSLVAWLRSARPAS